MPTWSTSERQRETDGEEGTCLVVKEETEKGVSMGTSAYPVSPRPSMGEAEALAEADTDEELVSQRAKMDGEDNAYSPLAIYHEDALRQCGVGRFHWLLLLAAGMGLAADIAELVVLPFVLPSAEVDLCINHNEKKYLGAATYLSLGIGALLWGSMADRVGRRRTLLTALTVASVFDIMTALMPTYGTFITARAISGLGMGGALPILMTYFCEFVPLPQRGRYINLLLACWALGGIFVSCMAWAIMPRTGFLVVLDGENHFSAWHIFLIVCGLPTPFALVLLLSLPESPRYLLEANHEREALVIYQKIYGKNTSRSAEYQLSELELPGKKTEETAPLEGQRKSIVKDISYSIRNFSSSFVKLFNQTRWRISLPLICIWVGVSFAFYGLMLWFPEYVKSLKAAEYAAHAERRVNKTYENMGFNQTLENINFIHSRFVNVSFGNLIINHVLFDQCYFDRSHFTNIKSSQTLFRNSTLRNSHFVDTDLFEYRFENCDMVNNTFTSMDAGCSLDFDYNIHLSEVFLESLIGEVALIPGFLLAAFTIEKFGRVRLIVACFVMCGFLSIAIIGVHKPWAVIGFEGAFNFIFAIGYSALNLLTTETYSTQLRATGWGLLICISRCSGWGGVAAYSSMLTPINVGLTIPALTTAGILITSGLLALVLPETKGNLLK